MRIKIESEGDVTVIAVQRYQQVVSEICALGWASLRRDELLAVAWAYYYFSVQFRENLETACELYPSDERLLELRLGECDTDNLSPFPGIAAPGERMNHDEFMKRLVVTSDLEPTVQVRVGRIGRSYLEANRAESIIARALSISSYEDGGLERVFNAILSAPDWGTPSLAAFRHFLTEHIRFDSDPDAGHGALSRHLVPDDRILPLWVAFRDLLIGAVPALQR